MPAFGPHPSCTSRPAPCVCSSQERQRLETILSLCSELGRSARDEGGPSTSPTSAVADLRKINQKLEKLQLNDDDDDDDTPSVFSDSSATNGAMGNGHVGSPGSENGYCGDDDVQVRRRRSSGHRDSRAESPAVSLRSFAPSPSPRAQRTAEVRVLPVCIVLWSHLFIIFTLNPFNTPRDAQNIHVCSVRLIFNRNLKS